MPSSSVPSGSALRRWTTTQAPSGSAPHEERGEAAREVSRASPGPDPRPHPRGTGIATEVWQKPQTASWARTGGAEPGMGSPLRFGQEQEAVAWGELGATAAAITV